MRHEQGIVFALAQDAALLPIIGRINVLVRELKGLGLDVELLRKLESGEYRPAAEVEAEEAKLKKTDEIVNEQESAPTEKN